ncbi:hypothetical protein CDN99_08120 [Roseateles aquatilis]|uniref:histidine kinase n=1 Tax=Roseateles aquatilis TaxID=431061 RepID=A0A246JJ55_9BURK|nr:sensor histidine kinase [Roseateles aquatilis]OWQ92289.1 hypothetical protein CDN99_08120 [Roseateles aquatilis]
MRNTQPRSFKGRLLAWIIGPLALYLVIDTIALYTGALEAANAAYDRMLVTTAYSVGDGVRIEQGELAQPVPYASVEVHEAGYSSRLIYAIRTVDGKPLAGDFDLQAYRLPSKVNVDIVPSLLRIYEADYGRSRVRVAAVYQPLAPNPSYPGVIIQIAEPIEGRREVALGLLRGTLLRQFLLFLAVALTALFAVNGALKPLRELKSQLDDRHDTDLSPVTDQSRALELSQVVASLNSLMSRVGKLLSLQQRFVSDASHQLRTPLAVLKAQVQSGLRRDAPAITVLQEISHTVDRAVNLADKMLSLAKVEQIRGRGASEPCNVASIAQDVAIELSPLISEKNIEFSMDAEDIEVLGHPWMIAELLSNLMHNAIRHTPQDGQMGIRISQTSNFIAMTVWDTGIGISEEVREHLFEPFSATHESKGCGLGLAICAEIAKCLGGEIRLTNRVNGRVTTGLDASVLLPIEAADRTGAATPLKKASTPHG